MISTNDLELLSSVRRLISAALLASDLMLNIIGLKVYSTIMCCIVKIMQSDRRGRPKGLKNKLRPEIRRMLGKATLHNAHARFYDLAAEINPKDSTLWKRLYAYFVEQGKIDKAKRCLKKAVRADPSDITLRFHLASLYVELGDYQRAAESYRKIVQLYPENVEALKTGAKVAKIMLYGLLKSFISALHTLKDNVDARLTFASLLLEDAKHEEAISLLTPPNKLDAWWLNRRIKMKLCHIYRAKGMLEDCADTFLLLVRESLCEKIKVKKGISGSVLHECERGDNQKTDSVYGGHRTEEKDDIGQLSWHQSLVVRNFRISSQLVEVIEYDYTWIVYEPSVNPPLRPNQDIVPSVNSEEPQLSEKPKLQLTVS
ncbi:hypothetical protein Q3G72_030729 [Acer saccharum]|nr:hypothetical protein Q3G72_030729 [Acer saccharum]